MCLLGMGRCQLFFWPSVRNPCLCARYKKPTRQIIDSVWRWWFGLERSEPQTLGACDSGCPASAWRGNWVAPFGPSRRYNATPPTSHWTPCLLPGWLRLIPTGRKHRVKLLLHYVVIYQRCDTTPPCVKLKACVKYNPSRSLYSSPSAAKSA